MNLKLKATLLWLLAIVITFLATLLITAAVIITFQHPTIVLMTCIVTFIIYVLVSAWFSIYHHLKSKE